MQEDQEDRPWLLLGDKKGFKKNRPNKIKIENLDIIVAFLNGKFEVFANVCPHRLSSFEKGKINSNRLVCPYHGAEFDENGALLEVPAIRACDKTPKINLTKFQLHEDSVGLLWVNFSKFALGFEETFQESIKEGDNLHFDYTLDTKPMPIIENFVDCSHTNFVHGGLFRGAPKTEVTVEVETKDSVVKITTLGEKDSSALLYKLFNPTGEDSFHTDEYIAPYTVRVIYKLSFFTVTTVSILTPVEELKTKVKTIVNVKGSPIRKLLLPILKKYVWKVLKQDFVILNAQAKNLSKEKDSYFPFDIPIIEIHKTFKAYTEGRKLGESSKRFKMML